MYGKIYWLLSKKLIWQSVEWCKIWVILHPSLSNSDSNNITTTITIVKKRERKLDRTAKKKKSGPHSTQT